MRLFGIPVGYTLQNVDANVQFRFEFNQKHGGARHFAEYLHSRDVQASITDLGYRDERGDAHRVSAELEAHVAFGAGDRIVSGCRLTDTRVDSSRSLTVN